MIKELAEAIIVSFEEEMRARKLIELGLLDELLKELLAIGEELGIKDELLSAFQDALRQQEGVKVSTDELKKPEGPEAGQTAKTKEQIAKLADTWLKVLPPGHYDQALPRGARRRLRRHRSPTSTASCTASRPSPWNPPRTRRSPG